MPCTNCGRDNAADAAYCERCGYRLEFLCPACSAPVSYDARFCKDCGARLAPPNAGQNLPKPLQAREIGEAGRPAEAGGAERKTLTALFSDLKDFTELTRDLDPESAGSIVDPALKIMGEAVRYCGGYVAQSTGDGIFALFGAPLAEEDHAQRALHAALRMQQHLREYSDQLIAKNAPPLEARVGIHTGEVVMRSVEAGGRVDYLPVGYATNLAARMQTVARAGGIAISEETRRLIEGYFELRALGPRDVKGALEPVNVYEVTGPGPLRTRFELSARRGLTPFVGRDEELEQLKSAFELSRSGHGQVLAVIAEAGAGKTRLLYEFKRDLPAKGSLLEAHSVAHHKGAAYEPVLELLYTYFGIDQADGKATRRAKVETRLTSLDPALSDTLPYVFALLGIQNTPDPIAEVGPLIKRRRTFEAFTRIIAAESLDQPTVVIFEDLHWIDRETQGMLDVLAGGIADARVLLLLSYRPEYPHDWGNKSYYTEVRLDRLSQKGAGAMLRALLGAAAELEDLKRLIDQRTEGNPLFIEETVRALFEEGTLVRTSSPDPFLGSDEISGSTLDQVKFTRPLSDLRLPATVQGILAARIDRLDPAHKELLQTLAVMGREPPLGLIRELGAREPGELDQMLRALQAGEFIYEQLEPGGSGYKFKHVRTQEVAYNSLLIERRRQIHQRAAEAIELLYAGHLDDQLSELAHHYSRADNVAEAVKYLGLAAKREIVQSAYESALQQLTSARELLARLAPGLERDRIELELLIDFGVTLLVLKGFYVPELGEAYQRAASLCKTLGETERLMPVLFGLSSFHLCRAELKLARRHIEEMRRLPLDSKNARTILTGWLMGNAQFFIGDFREAHGQFEQAVAFYDRSMHRSLAVESGQDPCVSSLIYDAMALLIMGFPEQAENRVAAAMSLARELNHPFTLAVCLMTAANYLCIRRDFQRLPPFVAELTELAGEHGFTFYQEGVKVFENIALVREGKVDEVRARSRSSKRFSELRYELALTWAQSTFAEAFASLGLTDVAKSLLNDAAIKMNRNDERFVESEIQRIHGVLALRQSGSRSREEAVEAQRQAEQAFRTAHAIALGHGAKLFALRASVALAALLSATSRRPQGEEMLDQCLSSFTEGFDCPDLVEARAALERCRSGAVVNSYEAGA
ncbi:MAG: AAA family ATPase [Deltaproteobacteria bacterium]|nr:AAA family ATPase [Deltaproteobacteria bacterium]